MLQNAGPDMEAELLHPFNLSYASNNVPAAWKTPTIALIPKAWNDTQFRPISLLSCLSWICQYLQGRTAVVHFQGTISTLKNFENGTPQGGIFSPLFLNVIVEKLVCPDPELCRQHRHRRHQSRSRC